MTKIKEAGEINKENLLSKMLGDIEIYKTGLNIRNNDIERLQGQYQTLENQHSELYKLAFDISRSACLDQVLDNKCICFSCKAKEILKGIDQ